MLNLEIIGRKIANLRKQKDMKQNELADALFVTHQAVSKWENGKSLPTVDILYEITRLFDVTIDYLLDDTEIKENDYEALLRNSPRETVITKFLQKDDLGNEIDKIFYLLNKQERELILNLIIAGKIRLDPNEVWHLLSAKERTYLLGSILNNKFKYDLSKIYHKLTIQEEQLVRTKFKEGIYKYKLPDKKGVIIL